MEILKVERRERPGMVASLVFGTPATPGRFGWYAEVRTDPARRLELSMFDDEDHWTIDAAWGQRSYPIFVNGFGCRSVITRQAPAELDDLLTRETMHYAKRLAGEVIEHE